MRKHRKQNFKGNEKWVSCFVNKNEIANRKMELPRNFNFPQNRASSLPKIPQVDRFPQELTSPIVNYTFFQQIPMNSLPIKMGFHEISTFHIDKTTTKSPAIWRTWQFTWCCSRTNSSSLSSKEQPNNFSLQPSSSIVPAKTTLKFRLTETPAQRKGLHCVAHICNS